MGYLTGAAPEATSTSHWKPGLLGLGISGPRHAKGTWAGASDSRSPPRSETTGTRSSEAGGFAGRPGEVP
jgi:hypothetical protein